MKKLTLLLFILASFSALWAQEKFALVIGNGKYTSLSKLTNPVNDAEDIAATLNDLGFDVDIVLDGNLDQMENAIIRLKNRLSVSRNSYGFFFYAGHGVQSNSVNYLIPVSANIPSESFLRDRAVSVQAILSELNDANNELNIVVLDACRDNPFGWARSGNRGLTVVSNQPADSIIVYATSAGSVASDGNGRNGLFTSYLLNNLKTPGLEVKEIFNRTGAEVAQASNRQQIPAVYNQFFGNAYFVPDSSSDTLSERVLPSTATRQPSPMPLPSDQKQAAGKAVSYGAMNIAFGLGSYLQGDTAGGLIVTGGYAATLGLIAWELSLSRGDGMAGVAGPIGIGVGAATLIFGFVKPFIYNGNRQLESAMSNLDIALVSSNQNKNVLAIKYTYSF
jgi:hypothetical protein